MSFVFAIFSSILLLASACDPAVPPGEVTGECSQDELEKGTEAYFLETMVPQVFEPYCSYCHWSDKITPEERKGATEGLNYDDFVSATSLNTDIAGFGTWHEMSKQTMPPMGRLPSTEEMQLVLDWINCELAARPQGDDDDSAGDDDDSSN
jgi:mono/diheme cytochrome c family protein